MTQNTPATSFVTQLHTERDALKAFVALLDTEQQALVNGHIEQLLELAERKIKSAQELNQLEIARLDKLGTEGAPVAQDRIEAWLRTHAQDSLQVWRDIQQLAGQAQEINRANGVLIQTRLRHNQQALTVLHKAANSAQGLYGPDGQPRIASSGRTLGSV